MTEEEWLASADPQAVYLPDPPIDPQGMLQCVRAVLGADRTKAGRRKLRLVACALCRRHWPALREASRAAVEVAERYADGQATSKERVQAWRTTVRQYGRGPRTADGVAGHVVEADAMIAAVLTANVSYSVACRIPKHHHELWGELSDQAALIQEVFGNPFRPVVVDSRWRTPLVMSLAQAAYEDRLLPSGELDSGRLAVLADALEEVGADAALIAHLRAPGPHVRGCHLLDLVLRKG